jgi:hypothetical protein
MRKTSYVKTWERQVMWRHEKDKLCEDIKNKQQKKPNKWIYNYNVHTCIFKESKKNEAWG